MQLSWPTVVVVFIVALALVALAFLKVQPEYLVAVGTLGAALAGAMKQALSKGDKP
jgi:hypothetical protein